MCIGRFLGDTLGEPSHTLALSYAARLILPYSSPRPIMIHVHSIPSIKYHSAAWYRRCGIPVPASTVLGARHNVHA